MKMKILALIFLSFIASSCVSNIGNPKISDQSLIDKIERGKTTKSEIEEMFGTPNGKKFENNSENWDYVHEYSKTNPLIFIGAFLPSSNLGVSVNISALSVVIDSKTQRVINYSYSSSGNNKNIN